MGFVIAIIMSIQITAIAQDDLAQDVKRLVRQLDALDVDQRDQAERELMELGTGILSHLPNVTPRMPAEVKERLGRITKVLEERLAKEAANESRVTLSGKFKFPDLQQKLFEQTGNEVVGLPASGEVEVSFDDVPYWVALDQVLDQAQLTIDQYGGQTKKLSVMSRPDGQADRYGLADYQGIFRFEALQIDAVRSRRSPVLTAMRLRLEITWEPRLTPVSISLPLAELNAESETGESIEVLNPEGSRSAGIDSGISNVELELPFALPDRSVKMIKSLKGTMDALVPGRLETFQFDDLRQADNLTKQKAGVSVTLERIRKNEDLYEVMMRLRFDEAANALESHRGWVFANESYMLDANGQKVENLGSQTTYQGPNEIGIAYLFALEGTPDKYSYVYRTPAMMIQMPVKFQLNNIPLP